MALIRFQIDLAIPAVRKLAARDAIRGLKALAVRVNEGAANEEMTVRAVWHRCHHDTGDRPCEPEQEI